jgi:hypothetical protein
MQVRYQITKQFYYRNQEEKPLQKTLYPTFINWLFDNLSLSLTENYYLKILIT